MATITVQLNPEALDRAIELIAVLNRKAARIGAPAVTLVHGAVRLVKLFDDEGCETGQYYEMTEVTVTGEDLVIVDAAGNRYDWIAVLEHSENGVIIKMTPDHRGESLPEEYRTAAQRCQHCGTVRQRNKTFVLRTSAGALMTVGSDCLTNYVNTANPTALIALIEEMQNALAEMMDADADSEEYRGGRGPRYIGLGVFLAHVAALISVDGYTSKSKAFEDGSLSTAEAAMININERRRDRTVEVTDTHVATAEAAIAWYQ